VKRINVGLLGLALGGPLVVLATVVAGDPPASVAMSKVAPADDLVKQLDAYVAGCREGLTDEQTYDNRSRTIAKDANTLAAIALALAMHDQPHRLTKVAPALLLYSQDLAKAQDFESAKKAFADLERAAAGQTSIKPEVKWERVAGLGQLMKQVTFVNNRLRRNMRRFEERKDDNARDAALLAVIAQAATYDTHEVDDPADLDKWYQLCGEMRDAAGDVNAKIHAADKAGAEAALGKLAQSCESCHEIFRVRAAP
jgi:hypothetical protein